MKQQYNYNFHTHTFRCGHASWENEEEYINKYIENGFNIVGFSDHMPFPIEEFPQENVRMYIKNVDEYIIKLKKLRKKYNNIKILIGFECEYDRLYNKHLLELKEKCDYLILGQHFIRNINPNGNINYPLLYAEKVCEALDTGLFDYLAHPDLYLKYRETIKKEDYSIYIENCEKAALMICKKSKKLNIPLEINLTYRNNIKILNDNMYPYPHPIFFNISKSIENNYVVGIDAHKKNSISKINNSLYEIKRDLNLQNNILKYYNPQYNRSNILEKKLNILKKNVKSYTYEYLKVLTKDLKYNIEFNSFIAIIKKEKEKTTHIYNKNINNLINEINILKKTIIDISIKNKKINRKKIYIKYNKKSY